jgi:hypothetical protein
MEITNELIYEKLVNIERMLESLTIYNKSDKFQILEKEVRITKGMNVNQVQTFLGGISRNWALNLMKKLGKENHFGFVLGDKSLKKPSLIIYEEDKVKKEKHDKIKELVDKENIVTIAQIAEFLHLTLGDNLIIIRKIIKDFIEVEKQKGHEYYIKEENKLCKKT